MGGGRRLVESPMLTDHLGFREPERLNDRGNFIFALVLSYLSIRSDIRRSGMRGRKIQGSFGVAQASVGRRQRATVTVGVG